MTCSLPDSLTYLHWLTHSLTKFTLKYFTSSEVCYSSIDLLDLLSINVKHCEPLFVSFIQAYCCLCNLIIYLRDSRSTRICSPRWTCSQRTTPRPPVATCLFRTRYGPQSSDNDRNPAVEYAADYWIFNISRLYWSKFASPNYRLMKYVENFTSTSDRIMAFDSKLERIL